MGVIVREEYVCDYCGKPITDGDVLMGRLSLRKRGARGVGREVALALHVACSDRLTDNAAGTQRRRRPRAKAAVEEEPVAPAKAKRKVPGAPRRPKSSFAAEST